MNGYPVDSRGKKISVGDMVAYNKSGSVIDGVVISIKRRTDSIAVNNRDREWGQCLQWIIEIDYGQLKNSIVKDTNGILVIR